MDFPDHAGDRRVLEDDVARGPGRVVRDSMGIRMDLAVRGHEAAVASLEQLTVCRGRVGRAKPDAARDDGDRGRVAGVALDGEGGTDVLDQCAADAHAKWSARVVLDVEV